MSSSDSKSHMVCGPWKLFRFILRVVLFGALVWLILALLWAFLPSPAREHNPDNGSLFPTAQLRAGKTLTRVYDSNYFRIDENDREGFALDYKLDMDNLTLTIGGTECTLPILVKKGQMITEVTQQIEVVARRGDRDGANLPWFEFADSILLYWWIGKEDWTFVVEIRWTGEGDSLRRMEVEVAGHPDRRALLTIEMQGEDSSTIIIEAPERPLSFSPSTTYPIRVAIIHIIAPTAVFVNDLLGNTIGVIIKSMVTALLIVLGIGLYGFAIFVVVFSLWRCLGGPSLEVTVERIQGRLDSFRQNERLEFLRIAALQERLNQLSQNERFKAAVDICRNGWHPERQASRAAEEEIDVEKGASPKD